jgi:glycine/D-amino acid oxidase-like deaminating enzyme
MSVSNFDYIIVGGGCIGVSTAKAIKTAWPEAPVAWFPGTKESAASNDFMKIIRHAYPEGVISQYAKSALQAWRSDPYRAHFHQTAWIQAIEAESQETMNKGENDEKLTTAQMTDRVGSSIEPILDEGEELYLNREVGYADSACAVRAVSEELEKLGVVRYKDDVTKVLVEEGICTGVEAGGIAIKAKKNTIVSVGAWTPGLLVKSNISFPRDFFTVTAVGVATLALSDEEFKALKSMPILVTKRGECSSMRTYRN